MMQTKRWFLRSSIIFVCTTLIIGCQYKLNAAEPNIESTKSRIPVVSPFNSSESTNKDTYHLTPSPIHSNSPPSSPLDSSKSITQSGSHTVDGVKSDKGKTTISSEAFNIQQPSLMGIRYGDKQEKVKAQFGNPKNIFTMEDPAEPITVYDYKDFSVGFNKANLVEFVDVSSSQVEPGLNGLRLGQSSADAAHVLGKPDTHSSYVMSYKSKTAVLKLDIDPKTKSIQSIKLFGRNDN